MSFSLLHLLILWISAFAWSPANAKQIPLHEPITIMESSSKKVPGSNNATFCAVPEEQQLFKVDFLEVAPSPLPVNKIIFVYLRGEVPDVAGLKDADLQITIEAKLDSGEELVPQTYTVPLKTNSFGGNAHLSIRNESGEYEETLTPGQNDVLTDHVILGMFVKTGSYTFRTKSQLPDGRHLFCFEMTQWLEGKGF